MTRLAEKIGQMLLVGFEGLKPPRHILRWLESGRIGGVYLFARNIESPAQVKRLVADCRAAASARILVGIDQEGGVVARLRQGFSESPGAMALGASGDPALAEDVAAMLGREMAALGVNWNFAPVADIARQRDNPSIGARSFGRDPQRVSDCAGAQIRGFQGAGVAATVKHFPGLGGSVIDTHEAPAKATGSLSSLYAQDLLPFKAAIAADVGCVMLTHVTYDALDSQYPATLSPRIVDGLLRQELGYDGAVCTDCMEMKAITDVYGAGESALLSVLAGVDMVLHSHTRAKQEAAYDALLAAAQSGKLPEERIAQSLRRIEALKRRFALERKPPLEIVGCAEHLALSKRAARAGAVLLRRGDSLPLASSNSRIALIELGSQPAPASDESVVQSRFARQLSQRLPQVACHWVDPAADAGDNLRRLSGIISGADTIILVTRDAHRQPAQLQLARQVCAEADSAILICARNPYDAGMIAGAESVICVNGDSGPSLAAAVEAICGDYRPSSRLAVEP